MDQIIEKAADFIWRNGRLLERRRFEYLFKGGSPDLVLSALKAYQNEDGGFGNALEPDKRTPHSQPVDQEIALQIMGETKSEMQMLLAQCDFLETVTKDDGGVPVTLSSVNSYPHAPWWTCDNDNPPASINPTGSIVGWLHKFRVNHPWLNRATDYCWNVVETYVPTTGHDMFCILTFLQYVPDREKAICVFDRLTPIILASDMIAMDVDAQGYVHKPLDYAATPLSICRSWFSDDVINRHLDALIVQQQSDGGWPIFWECVSKATELEWRGMATINALKTLKAYGRLII